MEDGSVVRDRTLAAILAENKEKKEEEFQNVWKSMKQGDCNPSALSATMPNLSCVRDVLVLTSWQTTR